MQASSLYRTLIYSAFSIYLTACGGGSSSTPTIPVEPPAPTPPPAVDVSPIVAADPGSALPANWQKGAFIEVNVRAYKDSDGDGIGDLKGLTQSLDYLKDLGVKGIWLMPITKSQDHDHGYAVTDYRDIEAQYGTLADFDALLTQAHSRGIGIIIDYVMNHSAAQNPLFLNSQTSSSNAYRNWYIWQATAPTGWNIYGNNPWYTLSSGAYFAGFWSQMPDFNLLNPDVVTYHKNSLRFWLNRGVDGFRFDAVGNLVENDAAHWEDQPQNYTIMNEIRSTVASYSQRYMVCEAPADPQGFAAMTACGSTFAFDLRGEIASAARNTPSSIQKVSDYFKTATSRMATMVSNHDSFAGDRLWNQVGGDVAQYRLAAASYLLQPGTPFIYYGEEIGMSNAPNSNDDSKLRTPMSWTANTSNAGFTTGTPFRFLSGNVSTQNVATQLSDPNSLLSFYKGILAVRNTYPSIAQGTYDFPFVSGSVLGFQRTLGAEKTLVLINYDTVPNNVTVNNLPANANVNNVYPAGGANATASAGGSAIVTLAAQSIRVFILQ